MMVDDKLTHEERRRLEAVNQAIRYAHTHPVATPMSLENILCAATLIDVFLETGKPEMPAHIDEKNLTFRALN